MALQFWPRGGSAQVVRYLAPEIVAAGWPITLVTGSLGGPGEHGYAPEFFAPLPVTAVDYTAAMESWKRRRGPVRVRGPAASVVRGTRRGAGPYLRHGRRCRFRTSGRSVVGRAAFRRACDRHGGASASPDPDQRGRPPAAPGACGRHLPARHRNEHARGDHPARAHPEPAVAQWPFAHEWADRMRAWAAQADRVIVDSPTDTTRAMAFSAFRPERVTVVGSWRRSAAVSSA